MLRDAALREPRLALRSGVGVDALVAGESTSAGVPHVTGVKTSAGETLRADLVVDATGRGSRAPNGSVRSAPCRRTRNADDSGFTYYRDTTEARRLQL